MKTVTLCGSMRFREEMQRLAFALEVERGWNVLQCAYNIDNVPLTDAARKTLAAAHRRRIELSDAIYVVDIGGYIGEAVRDEIEYAQALGKEIILHSQAKP